VKLDHDFVEPSIGYCPVFIQMGSGGAIEVGVKPEPRPEEEAEKGMGRRLYRWVRPKTSTRDNDLPLASTTRNKISINKLSFDDAHMAEVLSHIDNPETFESLFEEKEKWGAPKRPISRGMEKHEEDLLRYDLIEKGFDGASTPPATLADMLYVGCFLVRKKNGTGRFIADCRPVNAKMRKPPPMGLPSLHQAIQTILSFDVAAKTDGVGYFNQFELHSEIRQRYFRMRLAGRRGRISDVNLVRLPMGWAFSPWVAQQTSNFIIRPHEERIIGVAWVDDFVVGGTKETFSEHRRIFRERTDRYNVEVDNVDLFPTTNLKALGLEFDLEKKRYRIDPAWIDKRLPELEALADGLSISHREFMRICGSLIWADYARRRPLWLRAEMLAALSQASKTGFTEGLDALYTIPKAARENLSKWFDDIKKNEWIVIAEEGEAPTIVFSDASDTAIAFIHVVGEQVMTGEQWLRTEADHIFLAELRALAMAAHVPGDALYVTDNTALCCALNAGHSSSYAANAELRQAFGSRRPKSRWIPTHLNPADRYTRGQAMPSFPRAADEEVRSACAWIAARHPRGDHTSE